MYLTVCTHTGSLIRHSKLSVHRLAFFQSFRRLKCSTFLGEKSYTNLKVWNILSVVYYSYLVWFSFFNMLYSYVLY